MINHENRRKIIIIIISIVVAVVLVSIAISELRSYQQRIELGEHEYQELLNDITNFHSGYLMYSSFKNSTDATGMMKCDQGKVTMSLAILHINEPYRTYYYLTDVQKDRLREYIMNNMVSEELQTLRDQCAIIKTIAP
jgi:hypothetical protein